MLYVQFNYVNYTVKRRIDDEVSECIEKKLIRIMCNNLFSIQVDEFTLSVNKCFLLVCLCKIAGDATYEQLAFNNDIC